MRNIVLLRPDRNGDALKSLPALRALAGKMSDCNLHLICSQQNASVFEFEPGYSLHILPKNWKRMKRETLLSSLIGFPSNIDTAVNLLCDPNAEVIELLRLLISSKKYSVLNETSHDNEIIEIHLPDYNPAGRDETLNIGSLLAYAFGIELATHDLPRYPILSSTDEKEAAGKMGNKLGKWLGVCPFAGESNRSHSRKRWGKFIARVNREGTFEKIFLFGAPSDYDALEKLRSASFQPERVELCFPSSFRTLGAYLKRLDGVIAVDSGPLHLALSLGVRSLGILSGGDVERWFPTHGTGDLIIRRGLLQRFPSVFEMVRAFERWNSMLATA